MVEIKTAINIRGTECHSCKALIEDVCMDVKGVKSCSVDFRSGKAVIVHDGALDLGALKKEIESLGKYRVDL